MLELMFQRTALKFAIFYNFTFSYKNPSYLFRLPFSAKYLCFSMRFAGIFCQAQTLKLEGVDSQMALKYAKKFKLQLNET